MKNFTSGVAGLAIAIALIATPAIANESSASPTASAAETGEGGAAAEDALTALTFGKWGVDLGARDTSVKPGDDFDKYANGGWFARTEIPADQASAGVD